MVLVTQPHSIIISSPKSIIHWLRYVDISILFHPSYRIYTILYYIKIHHIIQYHIILIYITLYYIMLCYITLHYIILNILF